MGKEGGPLHLFYDFTNAMFLGKLYLSLAAFPETNLTMSVTEGKMFMELRSEGCSKGQILIPWVIFFFTQFYQKLW